MKTSEFTDTSNRKQDSSVFVLGTRIEETIRATIIVHKNEMMLFRGSLEKLLLSTRLSIIHKEVYSKIFLYSFIYVSLTIYNFILKYNIFYI